MCPERSAYWAMELTRMQDKNQEKKQKVVKKGVSQKKAAEQPVEVRTEYMKATMGDILERIHKACDARKLSEGSRRNAVSMANSMFKRYGSLPTAEQVKADAANPKQRGNWLWLLKLVSSQ